MRKCKLIIAIATGMIFMTACGDNMKNCVEGMMDDGYSYIEARDACEDARYESNIR